MRGFDIGLSLDRLAGGSVFGGFVLSMLPQARDASNGGCTLFTTRRRHRARLIVAPHPTACHHPRRRMSQYSSAVRYWHDATYRNAEEYWMPAFAGMTADRATVNTEL
jgi:hypothetical protein